MTFRGPWKQLGTEFDRELNSPHPQPPAYHWDNSVVSFAGTQITP